LFFLPSFLAKNQHSLKVDQVLRVTISKQETTISNFLYILVCPPFFFHLSSPLNPNMWSCVCICVCVCVCSSPPFSALPKKEIEEGKYQFLCLKVIFYFGSLNSTLLSPHPMFVLNLCSRGNTNDMCRWFKWTFMIFHMCLK